ncbi:MAG: DUF4956 domain-containing protein [Lachnospiraceae bacterium]|nr:DUF4956 domain-containing protein [Lachnospiraceae bacterium]
MEKVFCRIVSGRRPNRNFSEKSTEEENHKMTFQDIIRKSFIEDLHMENMDWSNVFLALLFSFIMALYLFVVYRFFVRKSLYNMNMNIAIVGMTIVTTAVILTIQSNLILSLGMVGALSIVRYRTAVKDPMDLFFLFWAIANGIMCGANQFVLGIIVSIFLTGIVFVLTQLPTARAPYVLVVNASGSEAEKELSKQLGTICSHCKVKSRNITGKSTRIIMEIRTKEPDKVAEEVEKIREITAFSLLTYEGDIVS